MSSRRKRAEASDSEEDAQDEERKRLRSSELDVESGNDTDSDLDQDSDTGVAASTTGARSSHRGRAASSDRGDDEEFDEGDLESGSPRQRKVSGAGSGQFERRHTREDAGQDDEADEDDEAEDLEELLGDGDLPPASEASDAEDLMEEMEKDYVPHAHLDTYDGADLDEREFEPLSFAARLQAEQFMEHRDRATERREGRIPTALMAESDDSADEELNRLRENRRRRRRARRGGNDFDGGDDDDDDDSDEDDLGSDDEEIQLDQTVHGPLREYVVLDRPRRTIQRRFERFLMTTVDPARGQPYYAEEIRKMCAGNKESLVVSYLQLSESEPLLSLWLTDAPREMLQTFDEVALSVTLRMFPDYERIHKHIHVRIQGMPVVDRLRDVRQTHLNVLVHVQGVVTRRTSVFPQLHLVYAQCASSGCGGDPLGPFDAQTVSKLHTMRCPGCDQYKLRLDQRASVYRNYQRITLQESPGSVPAGRLPRSKEVVLHWDLCDVARPGEEIDVTGIYKHNYDTSLNVRNGFPVFSTVIEANYIDKTQDLYQTFNLTAADERQIRRMARDQAIGEKIVGAVAPSIYGHEDIKMALALALFGGESKTVSHRIRGDINVLIMGDPGTAKSQFLKYVEKTAHRAVYTTGQGASAVGLTAAVRMDHATREWTLEGGALVLADQGVCLIDEFDKMNDKDRTSIHEAMEQQSISISKAGIVTTLQARCSVIAAANPVKGRYDPALNFSQNVDLTEPILSRFDILCVVRDTVDAILDENLASFVVESHIRSHPEYARREQAAFDREYRATGAPVGADATDTRREQAERDTDDDDGDEEVEMDYVGGQVQDVGRAAAEENGEEENGEDEDGDEQEERSRAATTAVNPFDPDAGRQSTDSTSGVSDRHQRQLSGASQPGSRITRTIAGESITQDMLRKYLVYARKKCHPKLTNIERQKIGRLYAEIRQRSPPGGGMPVGVRHVESIIRMSEAHAKMHLRDYVSDDDVNVAIRVMLNSFIGAQKMSIARTMNKHFRQYVTYKKDSNELLFFVLQTLVQETTNFLTFAGRAAENVIRIDAEELISRAQELNISDLQPFFRSDLFRNNGFVYNSSTKEIVKAFG